MRQTKAKALRRLAKQFCEARNIPNEGKHFLLPTRKVMQIADEQLRPDGTMVIRTIRLPPTPVFRWVKGPRLMLQRMKKHVKWFKGLGSEAETMPPITFSRDVTVKAKGTAKAEQLQAMKEAAKPSSRTWGQRFASGIRRLFGAR